MSTLYRKYRPVRWEDIIGQAHIVQTLTNELLRDSVVHSYLFTGPRGVGKTTTARLLAKAINCTGENQSAEPCENCNHCFAYQDGRAIDIIEIDAASHTGVDMVREHVIENARFLPTHARRKVFIIDEVHMLSTSAFNALLKTLEEPPAHALFILATTEPHKLLTTIRSRCEEYAFRRVPHDLIVGRLQGILEKEKRSVAEDVLSRVAALSEGCLRDAESLLGQILSIKSGEINLEDCAHILPQLMATEGIEILRAIKHKSAADGLHIIMQLNSVATDFYAFCTQLIELTRLTMLVKYKAAQPEQLAILDDVTKQSLTELSSGFSSKQFVRILEAFLKARQSTPSSPLPHLPIELAVVELCDNEIQVSPVAPTPQTAEPVAQPSSTPVPTTTPQQVAPTVIEQSTVKDKVHNVKEKIKHSIHRDIKTSLSEITQRLPEVIAIVAKTNHSLSFILKMAEPVSIESCKLTVALPFSFHADKLNETKCRRTIEDAFKDVYGERMELDTTVKKVQNNETPTYAPSTEPTTNVSEAEASGELGELAKAFGGEIE